MEPQLLRKLKNVALGLELNHVFKHHEINFHKRHILFYLQQSIYVTQKVFFMKVIHFLSLKEEQKIKFLLVC